MTKIETAIDDWYCGNDAILTIPERCALAEVVERLIAERNIERYAQTGALDVWYLSSLSADIDPVLSRLPDKARACVARPEPADDPWYQFNWSRSRASA